MGLRTEPGRIDVVPSIERHTLTLDHVWALAVVAVAVTLASIGRMQTADLAYHLRAGAEMLTTHRVPRIDTYTFTMAGHAWVDQQWGAQLLMTVVYRLGGLPGLALLRATAVGATFGFVWLACRAKGASPRNSSLLTIAGLIVGFLNTGMRPQTLAYPLFAVALWVVASRREHPRRLWLLPPMALVWANLHGSFPLLCILATLALVEDIGDRARTTRITSVVLGASTLATLVNPSGIAVWRYALGLATNPRILDQIREWEATSIRSFAGALFFISAVVIAGYLARREGPTGWMTLVWLGTFFVLALPALRGIVWWSFVFPVALAGLLPVERPTDRTGNRTLNLLVVALMICLLVLELPWWHDRTDPSTGASTLLTLAPMHLVSEARLASPRDARLFVSEPIASWFELEWPSAPVFVDSRIELFSDRVWDEYQDVMDGRAGWRETLDRWRVDTVVLTRDDTLLGSVISHDAGWRLVFSDDQGSVYVRA